MDIPRESPILCKLLATATVEAHSYLSMALQKTKEWLGTTGERTKLSENVWLWHAHKYTLLRSSNILPNWLHKPKRILPFRWFLSQPLERE